MNDNTFDALADKHRRELLVALLEENPQQDTIQIAAHGDRGMRGTDHRLRMAMYHNHLPKLVDYGFIRWNDDTHEVVKGPRFEEIQPLLELVVDYAENYPRANNP